MFLNGLSVWKTNNEQEGKEEMLPVAATCYIPARPLYLAPTGCTYRYPGIISELQRNEIVFRNILLAARPPPHHLLTLVTISAFDCGPFISRALQSPTGPAAPTSSGFLFSVRARGHGSFAAIMKPCMHVTKIFEQWPPNKPLLSAQAPMVKLSSRRVTTPPRVGHPTMCAKPPTTALLSIRAATLHASITSVVPGKSTTATCAVGELRPLRCEAAAFAP